MVKTIQTIQMINHYIYKMQSQQQLAIDYKILHHLSPPATYPPTLYDIQNQIQSKFQQQCRQFLKNQHHMHQLSKKIQIRLQNSIIDMESLDQIVNKRADKVDKICRQLNKINQNYIEYEKRQSFLGQICKLINMQQIRKILSEPKIPNQRQLIKKLKQIDRIYQQIQQLQSDTKIVVEVKEELSTLLEEATSKIVKGNMSESLVQSVTGEYVDIFLRDPKVSTAFISHLSSQRLSLFRIALNPLINNLSYAQNVAQLYQKIVQQWIKILDNEVKIFCRQSSKPEIKNITMQVMKKFISEVMPKMERGIYKVKSIVDVSKIRLYMSRLKDKLEEVGEYTWEPIPKIIMKTMMIIQERLDEEAEELKIAKYHIYSLASYVPIRKHLELIKAAKSYDPKTVEIDWQRGFKKLSQSRNPSKQFNNKSLLIFNLNIWYLYISVMKGQGQLKQQGQNMIKQGVNAIVNLNFSPIKKQYEAKGFIKLLDICAEVQNIKKVLYAEINLLGHDRLRNSVRQGLVRIFISEIYEPMLKQSGMETGKSNGDVIQICKKEKINLNKYGKQVESLKIYTVGEMEDILGR